eukprot:GHRR01028942.1.p1 GENE.GHRR01028942.1~~GHRR01028942.1.p1  ORF type:complete len:260 (+),score=142.63 GHRR01028942.1:76-780(+)
MSAAAAFAAAVRSAVKQSLGLVVSVGVGPNKLLAKLGSRASKPDGVLVLDSTAAVQALLAATPVEGLPGLGGVVASTVRSHGITTAAELQQYSAGQLSVLLGGPQQMKLAEKLFEWGHGRDNTPVVDKGPPKSIQVQMSLTPFVLNRGPLALAGNASSLTALVEGTIAAQHQPQQQQRPATHTDGAASTPAADVGSTASVLLPLLTGAGDTWPRLIAILGAMSGDLLGRVMLDR